MAEAEFAGAEFARLNDIAEWTFLPPDPGLLLLRIAEFDAYLCSLKVRVTREAIDRAAGKLSVIVTPTTGHDHIDWEYAASKGIALLSLRGQEDLLDGITATAELAWGLLIGVARNVPWAFDNVKRGDWGRDAFRGRQLSGLTLGILGYGRLGKMMAEYGRAFRMNVIACDVQPFASDFVRQVSFDELLAASDALSLHVHLTPENRGLIGREALARMKPGAILINTSRGGIVDEAALLDALRSERLAGAGLDVIDGEWGRVADHPLVRYANEHGRLLITPHIGGVTHDSQMMAYRRSVAQLREFIVKRAGIGKEAAKWS